MEAKIGEIRIDVSLLRQDLRNTTTRLTEAESRIFSAEDDINQLKAQVAQLRSQARELHKRAEDAENRTRRNNLRLVGFPEDIEKGQTANFVEDWLKSWMSVDALSAWFVIERAHRSLAPRPPLGPPLVQSS